ncbi:hypothetical protein V8D89_010883 [Ganoderma adspersum]
MSTSEIDVIFASKGRPPPSTPSTASSSSSLLSDKAKKTKKKRKTKDEDKPLKRKRRETDDFPAPPKLAKRKVPETVFDPSVALPSANQGKTAKAEKSGVNAVKSKKPKKAREEEDRFKDSRGAGPRRKTEEGFAIFKEDELGITDQAGGQYCAIRAVPLYRSPELPLQIPRCARSIANAVFKCISVAFLCINREDTLSVRAPFRCLWCCSGSIEAFPTALAMVERGQCVAKSESRIPVI